MVKSALPGPNVAPVGQDGTWVSAWYQYFQAEHNRTGGNSTDLILENTTDIGDATAQGLFTATQGSTSAGALATILLQVRTSIGEAFHAASIKLSSMAGALSRIEITADTVAIDGTLLNNGALLTGHAAPGAWTLTGVKASSGTVAAGAASAWTLVDSFTDTFTGGLPVTVDIGLDLDNTDAGDHTFNVALTYDSTNPATGSPPLYNASRSYLIAKSPAWFPFAKPVTHTPTSGSHTYRLYFNADSTAVRARIWDLNYAEIRR